MDTWRPLARPALWGAMSRMTGFHAGYRPAQWVAELPETWQPEPRATAWASAERRATWMARPKK